MSLRFCSVSFLVLASSLLIVHLWPGHSTLSQKKVEVLGKASGLFNLWTETETRDNSTVFKFTVAAKQNLPRAQIVWHLMPRTKLVKGDLQSPTRNMQKNEAQTFEVEVTAEGPQPPQAHAEVFTFQRGIKLGAAASFTKRTSSPSRAPSATSSFKIFQ